MSDLKVGDVTRWDRAWGVELDDPLWCLVLTFDGDEGKDVNIYGGRDLPTKGGIGTVTSFSYPCRDEEQGRCVIVPPEEWPDEVCKAVALYKLGVLTEGEE